MYLKNCAEFNRVVCRVFSALAETFPHPTSLDFEELKLVDGPAYISVNLQKIETEYMPQHEFAAQCIRFLIAEDYVTGAVHQVGVCFVLLTGKGLALINAVPDSIRS